MYYDDDSVNSESGELERLTHQINEKVLEVEDMVKTSLDERRDETALNNKAVDKYGLFYY